MSNLKSQASLQDATAPSRKIQEQHGGALLAANLASHSRLGACPTPGQDAQGNALRQLRHEQGIHPVDLATRACISLRQLYQLESGEHSLFYSNSLRKQAGRRVAALLGASWEQLGTPSCSIPND